MIRSDVLRDIDQLLVGQCNKCEMRHELNKKYRGVYSRIDGYCNKECQVGKQLQALGRRLSGGGAA